MRNRIVLALVGVSLAAGCNVPQYVSPCARIPAPTAEEIRVDVGRAEVDTEHQGVECELVNRQWVEDRG